MKEHQRQDEWGEAATKAIGRRGIPHCTREVEEGESEHAARTCN